MIEKLREFQEQPGAPPAPVKRMMQTRIVVAAVLVVILVAGGIWIGMVVGRPSDTSLSPYSAVYLTSGDIYFGKLSWLPWPRLENVWFLQRSQLATGETQLAVAPLRQAFWGPSERVFLNPRQVLFSTRLRADSPVAKAIEGGFGEPPVAPAPVAPDSFPPAQPDSIVPPGSETRP